VLAKFYVKGLTPKAVAAAQILLEWRPFIASWILFSYSGSSVACIKPGELNEAILDALIRINQIETQTWLE